MINQRKKRPRQKNKLVKRKKEPLWRRFLKEIPIIVIATLLTFIFSNQGLLRKLETTALDTTMRLRHIRTNSDIAIMRITDEEYKTQFGGKSPLDPTQVQRIINAIALGRPKLIGVDLDTSALAFREMQLTTGLPIIWARTAAYSNIKKQFHLFDVLGGKEPAPPSGVVLFKKDEDGAVRRYSRLCRTDEGLIPSFPWEVIKHLPNENIKALKESEDELIVNYVGSIRIDLPVNEILNLANEEGYQTDGILKDKIVLLGGDYAVQDEHDTPLGWMLGVEALAQMIETELEGGGVRPASPFTILLLEVLDGFVLIVLFRILSFGKALLVGILALPVLVLLCSFVAFWSLAHWAYFIPVLIFILGHQLYERGKEYFKKLPEQVANDLRGTKSS